METYNKTLFANRGVERNKKPLKNLIIIVEIKPLRNDLEEDKLEYYEKFKFKDLGYMTWSSGYERGYMCWHGFITPEGLKTKLGEKQWMKLTQGKREFIIQRRIDGKNIKKQK